VTGEVRRSWADKEHTRIRCYQFVEGRHSIQNIIADLKSRGVDWEKVELNYSATWFDSPNAEEIERQRQAEAKSAARQEAWERETLTRLTEKYGAPGVSEWDGVPGSEEDIIRHEKGYS
jgi:hypothetical protein